MTIYEWCRVVILLTALSGVACAGQDSQSLPDLERQATESAIDLGSCTNVAGTDTHLAVLDKLCEFAIAYRRQLPDFIAQRTITATGAFSTTMVNEQITFRKGVEHYSSVTINGKPAASSSTGSETGNIAFTSAGEFGSFVIDLFTVPGAVEFKYRNTSKLQGMSVAIYEFHVPAKANTFWTLHDPKGRAIRPELRGQLWVEPQTGHLLREEIEPKHLPASSGVAAAKTVVDYAMIGVGDAGSFLLPAKSQTRVCLQRPQASCATNVMVFHDYQKFGASTRILTADN